MRARPNEKGVMYLITMLIVVALMGFLMTHFVMRRPAQDKETAELLKNEGIRTDSSHEFVGTTKKRIELMEKQMLDREKRLFDQMDQY